MTLSHVGGRRVARFKRLRTIRRLCSAWCLAPKSAIRFLMRICISSLMLQASKVQVLASANFCATFLIRLYVSKITLAFLDITPVSAHMVLLPKRPSYLVATIEQKIKMALTTRPKCITFLPSWSIIVFLNTAHAPINSKCKFEYYNRQHGRTSGLEHQYYGTQIRVKNKN